jgi:hypothetical protein
MARSNPWNLLGIVGVSILALLKVEIGFQYCYHRMIMRIIEKDEMTVKQLGLHRVVLVLIFILLLVVLGVWLVGCSPEQSGILPLATSAPTSISGASTSIPITPTAVIPVVTQSTPNETMHKIVFENLAQGDSYIANLKTPTLFVADNEDDASRLTKLLHEGLERDNVIREIQQVDFATTWVVAVFRGGVGSSGYDIAVQKVSLTSNTVQVVINLTDPAPDQNVSAIESYPYHIILISKEQLPVAPRTLWAMYTSDGRLLAQITYP